MHDAPVSRPPPIVQTPVRLSQKLPPAQSRVAVQGEPGRPLPGSAQKPPAQTLPPAQSDGPPHGVPMPDSPLLEQPPIPAARTPTPTKRKRTRTECIRGIVT